MKINYFALVAVLFMLFSCKQKDTNSTTKAELKPPSEMFKKTWYGGKAELSSYSLQQARYGEIRNGEAVLIFVTEDFSNDKLVKLDEPGKTTDKTPVLKMNMIKKFVTGIYPYSMMLSVFTPVSGDGNQRTLKVNCSSQEWCGHTFSQLQLKGNEYLWQLHSYFEKEGEQDSKINAVLLEDELWNRIRLQPSSLPVGKMNLVPGLLWQRLSHTVMQPEEATGTLTKGTNESEFDSTVNIYTINYEGSKRSLQIYFKNTFPFQIIGWEESYPDGFGDNKKMLVTKAILKKMIWLDYWKHNTSADSSYIDSLQLLHDE